MRKKILFIALLLPLYLMAQESQKSLQIKFIEEAPDIDGVLDDAAWSDAAKATDFIMLSPVLGKQEPKNQKTVVRVLYDNTAIYIGAYLYDDKPANIPRQFATRDSWGQADFFEIIINPFNDKINDTSFFVSSAGTQADEKNGDVSWSAVWDSAVSINDDGWVVEIKIPYSALRFSGAKKQDWGINFIRAIKNKKEEYSWNFIDKTRGRESEYPGLLTGINNVNPPTRLSFYPFLQGTVTNYKSETDWKGTAGLDVKYGINDSFTLDATLIPDFGQTAFDDVVLNLGPFEEQYEEKRAFFTEGTELFSKGDLLYTRRIGATPAFYYNARNDLVENEELIDNPKKTKMLNAVKVSGRTQKGLGIGFFNAITAASYAKIRNAVTDVDRLFLTNPLTNYNVLVLDKTLPRSSSVSFINTNVMRRGNYSDANVSSVLFDYKLKNKKYVINSDFSMSNRFTGQKNDTQLETGYSGKIKLKEVLGAHRFTASVKFNDDKYNKNDLGYQEYNNFMIYQAGHSYRIFKPIGIFNRIYIKTWALLEYRQKPYVYTDNTLGAAFRFTTKKHLSYGVQFESCLGNRYDYYEPNEKDRFYKEKQSQYTNFWISTNSKKQLALKMSLYTAYQFQEYKPFNYIIADLSPRYRVNNQLQLMYNLQWNNWKNKRGYVDNIDDEIVFGNRAINGFTNSIQATYNLSTKSAFTLTSRHYWIQVKYDDALYSLQNDGTLLGNAYSGDYNTNYNRWNLDFSYAWEFAPGSQLVALYRNKLHDRNQNVGLHFFENIHEMLDKDATNEFSLKMIYYLDYNNLKSWF